LVGADTAETTKSILLPMTARLLEVATAFNRVEVTAKFVNPGTFTPLI